MTGGPAATTATDWVIPAAQARSEKTLERILDVTQSLMAKRPFREISIASIAAAARTSPPSIYARFENKQALLGALFARYSVEQRELLGQILSIDRWQGVPLGVALAQSFPVWVETYRARQGLIRAFLEQATEDHRFRVAWGELGEFIVQHVTQLVLSRPREFRHPDPEAAVRYGLEPAFATIVMRVLMHAIDHPDTDSITRHLVNVFLMQLGIADLPGKPDGENSSKTK